MKKKKEVKSNILNIMQLLFLSHVFAHFKFYILLFHILLFKIYVPENQTVLKSTFRKCA